LQLKEFDIILDIKRPIKNEYIEVVQGDYGTNVLNIQLRDGLNNYDLTDTKTEIVFAKPDGTTVIQDENNGVAVVNATEGRMTCTLNTNTIASPGKVVAEVRVSDLEGKSLTTARFNFFVRKPLITDDAIESTNEFPILNQLITTTEGLIQQVEQIEKQVPENVVDELNNLSALAGQLQSELNSHKAEMATELFHSKSTDHNSRKAFMTFVDDDGNSEFYTKWKPIIENKNIPVTCALITGRIGDSGYLTINQIKELKELGVEFVSHSHDHSYLGELTETELRTNFELSQAFLKQHGLTHDILVYPYGSQSILLRQVAREYFSCGVDILEGINVPPISTYRLRRKGWCEAGRTTLEDHKAVIDEVVANGGWLIWKTHAGYSDFTGEQLEWISEIIDYARNLGVEIVSVKEGLQKKGNPVDIGDIESHSWKNVAIIDSEGNAYGQNIGSHKFISYSQSGIDINGDISQFTKNCKTVFQINSADVTPELGLPVNRPGLLEVYRGISDSFGEQIYHQYRTGFKYTRYWDDNNSAWSNWMLLNPVAYLGLNGVTPDTPPTDDKLRGLFTITFINASGSTGFPENSPGLLLTYANYTANRFPRQEYTVYDTNKKYTRYWDDNNSAWSNWMLLNPVVYLGTNGVTPDTPPTDKKLRGLFTITFINTSGSTGFPENKAGLLLTYANNTVSRFPRQEYTVYDTNKKYTRYWDDTAWTDWVQIGGGSGSTANRPTDVHTGYMYFDTTLGKPVWWNGTVWVDANGETV